MSRALFILILGFSCAISLSYSGGGCGRSPLIIERCPASGDVVDLTGFWRDADKSGLVLFSIVQDGVIVTSTRLVPRVCDHQDGMGTTSQSMEDFTGEISGCSIIGQIMVCHAFDPPTGIGGIVQAELDATINLAQDRIEGTATVPVTGGSVTVAYERLGCQPKVPEDYLLPGTEIIAFITEHNLALGMITYSGQAPLGIEITRRVVAGVSGAVATVTPGSATDPTIIGVIVGNGNRIEYSLFGAFAVGMVSPGTAVNPSTIIGTIGEGTGPSGEPEFFMLQLRAFEVGTDTPINPDCVEQ